MFFSSTAEMIVTWGHSRTLWDLSLEKSIPPLISVFCGAVITAVKWRFIRGERVVAVGLSWDKATAGQVRSTSLSTITNTQIGLSKSVHLRLHGGKGWHAALQPPLVRSPSFVLPFVFFNGKQVLSFESYSAFHSTVNSYLNWSWKISKSFICHHSVFTEVSDFLFYIKML